MILNWITLIILLLATSCVGQGMSIDTESPQNSQATETKKREALKADSSGLKRKSYAPQEILVKFKEGTDRQDIEAIQRELHLKTIRVVSNPDLYLMKIPDGSSVEQVMEYLSKYEEVKYSEPNYVRTVR